MQQLEGSWRRAPQGSAPASISALAPQLMAKVCKQCHTFLDCLVQDQILIMIFALILIRIQGFIINAAM